MMMMRGSREGEREGAHEKESKKFCTQTHFRSDFSLCVANARSPSLQPTHRPGTLALCGTDGGPSTKCLGPQIILGRCCAAAACTHILPLVGAAAANFLVPDDALLRPSRICHSNRNFTKGRHFSGSLSLDSLLPLGLP